MLELGAREHGQPLPRVENEWDPRRRELLGMIDHRLAAVRGHDTEADLRPHVRDLVEMGVLHCARMKGGDLVVVEIGGDERLRGERLVDDLDVLEAEPQGDHPLAVGTEIMAHGCHGQRAVAEQRQPIGDVRGAAAVLAAHLGDEEGHVQDVNLVGEDVGFELIGENQDRVVRHGAANQGGLSAAHFLHHSTHPSLVKPLFYRQRMPAALSNAEPGPMSKPPGAVEAADSVSDTIL